jgi:hypothetical protein
MAIKKLIGYRIAFLNKSKEEKRTSYISSYSLTKVREHANYLLNSMPDSIESFKITKAK